MVIICTQKHSRLSHCSNNKFNTTTCTFLVQLRAIKTSCDTCSGVTWKTTAVQFIAPVHRRCIAVVLHCLGVLSTVDVGYRRRGVSYVSSSTGD